MHTLKHFYINIQIMLTTFLINKSALLKRSQQNTYIDRVLLKTLWLLFCAIIGFEQTKEY